MQGDILFREIPERVKWWTDARFGVSYHWGLYSIAARGEWVRSAERMSIEQYRRYLRAEHAALAGDGWRGEDLLPNSVDTVIAMDLEASARAL